MSATIRSRWLRAAFDASIQCHAHVFGFWIFATIEQCQSNQGTHATVLRRFLGPATIFLLKQLEIHALLMELATLALSKPAPAAAGGRAPAECRRCSEPMHSGQTSQDRQSAKHNSQPQAWSNFGIMLPRSGERSYLRQRWQRPLVVRRWLIMMVLTKSGMTKNLGESWALGADLNCG